MKEQKYRALVNYKEIKKGEILQRNYTIYDDVYSKGYSNGLDWDFLEDEDVELIKEPLVEDFTVGSKWIATCDITTSDDLDHAELVLQGEICVVDRVRNGSIRFEGGFWLTQEESAKLLLEAYAEPLREMTAEQVAKEFKVKVVG